MGSFKLKNGPVENVLDEFCTVFEGFVSTRSPPAHTLMQVASFVDSNVACETNTREINWQ